MSDTWLLKQGIAIAPQLEVNMVKMSLSTRNAGNSSGAFHSDVRNLPKASAACVFQRY